MDRRTRDRHQGRLSSVLEVGTQEMNAHPLPISRIPAGLPSEATALSNAIANVIATAELATSEVLRIGEVLTLRLVNHQRHALAEVPEADAMMARVEAAEAACRDRMAELHAAEEEQKNALERLAKVEAALLQSNRLVDSLKAELAAIRGPNPVA